MFRASLGGRAAAHSSYRHTLVAFLTPVLGTLACGPGWSAMSLALAAVLMSWDAAPTLAQRFESVLAALDAALPRRRKTGRTYQGFVKAWAAHSALLLCTLLPGLRRATREAAGKAWTMGGFVPIGADGSKFDAPRTIANEALGTAGKDKCGPQMMTLLLVHLGCMLPWAWGRAGVRTAERTLLRSLLDVLPERTLLVADAGFTGYELLSALRQRGVHFLVRVGSGVRLLRELGFYEREGRGTVYLWPDQFKDRAPLELRLVRVGRAYLITSVAEPARLSKKMAAELYRRRWGLEVAFRTMKQTLERREVRSCTPRHALAELDWAVVGLWVLGLVGAQGLRRAGVPPRRLSYAGAIAAVRHAARVNPSRRALHRRLARAVVDNYQRRGSKAAYRYPHKKNQRPPGPPRITKASARQVLAAKELRRRA